MQKPTFEKETDRIYRLKVPFEDLYTSVFLITTKEGNALVDCATNDFDVDGYIVPALLEIGLSLQNINYLALTHNHIDHAGGKKRILQLNPNIQVVDRINENFLKEITLYEMKGHTLDCIGVLDKQSGTLISGDGLQGMGVGKYRCSISSKEEYLKTIENIREDEKIKNILFSHAYEPWYKDGAFGGEEIEQCLQDCVNCIKGE